MSYQPSTIHNAISSINQQWFLPAIQREFVWKPEQIIQLFDSILRGYPISSFLFWELKEENRDKWEAYKFIENAKAGGTHNEIANTVGIHNMLMVLDGQQRLTSLLIGLKGTYTIKKKHKRKNDPSAWVKTRLFIDLVKDPKSVEDDEDLNTDDNLYYKLAFGASASDPSKEKCWFPIGKILDFDNEEYFYEFVDDYIETLPDDVTRGQVKIIRRNLERLYRAIWKDEVISYYKEVDQNYDRVLDIFIRANEGGTKLSKSDLLLSMVTSKWDGINAREEIFNFVDYLNNDLSRENNFDKDFIMKTCLVLTDLPVAYRVANFNSINLEKIRQSWVLIKSSITKTVDLINYFGIDRFNLTSVNSIIPIIYYISRNPELNFRGTTEVELRNTSQIRRWLILSLLNGVFGGSSDSILSEIRGTIRTTSGENFPIESINDAINHSNRKLSLDDFSISEIFSLQYGRKRTFLALSLLYKENGWGVIQYHQDHIFPKSMFSRKKLGNLGYDENEIYLYLNKVNSIGNLQFLIAHENQEKLDQPFDEWITTRESSFLQNNCIPEDPNLWKFENFLDFIEAREKLLKERYLTVL